MARRYRCHQSADQFLRVNITPDHFLVFRHKSVTATRGHGFFGDIRPDRELVNAKMNRANRCPWAFNIGTLRIETKLPVIFETVGDPTKKSAPADNC